MLVVKIFMYTITFFCVAAQKENVNRVYSMIYKSLEGLAHSCMVRFNGTEADLMTLRKDPPYPERPSCILKCLLEKIGIVNNNKFSKEGLLNAAAPFMFNNRKKMQQMKSVSEKCYNEVNGQDIKPCVLANKITNCVYKYAPEMQLNKYYRRNSA